MKKSIVQLVILVFIVVSCNEYELPAVHNVSFRVEYPDEFESGSPVEGAKVVVTNIQTGREYILTTDNSGVVSHGLRGGNYRVLVTFSEKRSVEINGVLVNKSVIFVRQLDGELITESGNEYLLKLDYSFAGEGFVIKELYCSSSRTPDDKLYNADKFVEIYNNTDRVLHADGICFGVVYPNSTFRPTPFVDENGDLLDRIPVWGYVAIVPGAGEEYPILPGESFIIAQSGLNHRDDPNGNPNSIDLSIADWEMYLENGKYVDIPSVPNIFMQKASDPRANGMPFTNKGTVTILFNLPSDNIEQIFENPDNYLQTSGSRVTCFMVPKEWVIDGVENPFLSDLGVYKRLHDEIDVGFIQHRGSGEKVSIRRKVSEFIDGRVVYMDTNNSSVDFLTNQEPMPGVISSK